MVQGTLHADEHFLSKFPIELSRQERRMHNLNIFLQKKILILSSFEVSSNKALAKFRKGTKTCEGK